MPSSYSPNLRIELIGDGEQAGTWGATTNNNLGTLIEDAISGLAQVTILSANQALTAANGAADQARNAIIELASAPSAFAVYAPPEPKQYTVVNNTSYTATIYNSSALGNTTAAGAGVAIPSGKTMTVWSDGTNFALQNTHLIGTVVGNVTGNLTGNVTGDVTGNVTGSLTGNVTGNAATAAALQTARTIGGVSFDGTANINLPGVNTSGNQNTSGSAASVSGTATAAIQTSALGSGTADNTSFLRGDRTWQVISTTPTTDQVLAATAGLTAGAVGTYGFMLFLSQFSNTYTPGQTLSGSWLRWANAEGVTESPLTPAGTWRCLGNAERIQDRTAPQITLWVRIS
jgi:hypothetical protein